MLEWTHHVKWNPPYCGAQQNESFTSTLRNTFMRGAPAPMKQPVIDALCMPDFMVGTAVSQLENLRAMT